MSSDRDDRCEACIEATRERIPAFTHRTCAPSGRLHPGEDATGGLLEHVAGRLEVVRETYLEKDLAMSPRDIADISISSLEMTRASLEHTRSNYYATTIRSLL